MVTERFINSDRINWYPRTLEEERQLMLDCVEIHLEWYLYTDREIHLKQAFFYGIQARNYKKLIDKKNDKSHD